MRDPYTRRPTQASRRTNQTLEARVYSHDVPIRTIACASDCSDDEHASAASHAGSLVDPLLSAQRRSYRALRFASKFNRLRRFREASQGGIFSLCPVRLAQRKAYSLFSSCDWLEIAMLPPATERRRGGEFES
eukprot:1175645-Prorocentrum_minimum.AAC.4